MNLKSIISGSTGNCASLLLEGINLILIDIGISFKQLNESVGELYGLDLKSNALNVLVLLTHNHTDHWKQVTYKALQKQDNLNVNVWYPQQDEFLTWNEHEIEVRQFKHGLKMTNFFIIDKSYGLLTDCEGSEIYNVLTYNSAYYLQELLIEANYDENYLDLVEQASLVNGYDVMSGFTRHLSKQEAEYIVESLQPVKYRFIHQSSRFFDVKGGSSLE